MYLKLCHPKKAKTYRGSLHLREWLDLMLVAEVADLASMSG